MIRLIDAAETAYIEWAIIGSSNELLNSLLTEIYLIPYLLNRYELYIILSK